MNTSKIPTYLAIGAKDRHWYRDTRNLFVELFGENRVPLVCKLFAATSINTSLKSNITLFRKALHEIDNGLPIGNYLPNIRTQLDHIRNGRELSGQKIRAFTAAMSGDTDAVVVDVWLLRAFGYINPSATKKQFDDITSFCRVYAYADRLCGIDKTAAEMSAIIWSGCRIYHTGDHNTRYVEILRHKMYNMFDTNHA